MVEHSPQILASKEKATRWLLEVIGVTTVAHKRPQSFCQRFRWQVTPEDTYTLDWTSWSGMTVLSRHSVGTYQGNELMRNLSGNCLATSCLSWLSMGKDWVIKNLHKCVEERERQTAVSNECSSEETITLFSHLECKLQHLENALVGVKWRREIHTIKQQLQHNIQGPIGRAPDWWSKGCKFESRQEQRENVLLQSQLCVLTLIWCLFHPCVTGVARKRLRSLCQKCGWRVTP